MNLKIHLIGVVLVCFNICEGARILGLFPTPSISHQIVFRALMEELAKRGHHLVVLTTDPVAYSTPEYANLTQIDVHDYTYAKWTEHLNFAKTANDGPMKRRSNYMTLMREITDHHLSTDEMQRIITNPNEKFDLVISEAMIPVMYAFKDRFDCPLIQLTSSAGTANNFDAVGNPSHPLIYPEMFSPYGDKVLGVWEKMYLLYISIHYRYMYYYEFMPIYDELAKKHFVTNIRPLAEIERNTDMVFMNCHPVLAGIRPLVPALVHLGSMHIKPPKPLPSALKKMLDNSKQGVVYFSLGGNVKSNQLSVETRIIFLDVFREMPYTVLWKWENDTLPDKPSNVIISKWFPQQDVLGHPNIKAFITQGGQQSLEEAIHYGVPLVGIPFMGDQFINVKKIVSLGIGKALDVNKLSVDIVRNAVSNVIEDSSYRTKIRELRDLMYDQPQSSLERAVWWTEYVLRHKGARHLRSPAVDTPAYQYYMLDVFAFISAVVAFTVIALCMVARCLKKVEKKKIKTK